MDHITTQSSKWQTHKELSATVSIVVTAWFRNPKVAKKSVITGLMFSFIGT